MKSHDLALLVQLVGDRVGLKISGQQLMALQRYVESRIKALRLSSINDYCNLLQTVSSEQTYWQPDRLGVQEWKQLIGQLTVGESYFFRDSKQIELLKTRIFPELIQRKRQSAIATPPTLRLWSAGCSTGEEVYSLAIVLQEMIPDWHNWDIQVIGTDVNAIAIEKAQAGLYPDWSFRHTQPGVHPKYLSHAAKGWQVSRALQQITRFHTLNLVSDGVPNPQFDLQTIDFIICRNVFIYFHPDAIAQVLQKFYAVLNPLGYLMTGHTELQGIKTQPFQVCCFPESILYQRPLHEPARKTHQNDLIANASTSAPRAVRHKSSATVTPLSASEPLSAAQSLSYSERSALSAIASLKRQTGRVQAEHRHPPRTEPQSRPNRPATSPLTHSAGAAAQHSSQSAYQIHLDEAEAYANSGQYAEALSACQQALQLQPFRIEPLYLLAHLAEENGDTEQAKMLLKKIIYLDPNAVAAYLELAMIYRRQGDIKRATKQLHHAFTLLNQMPETAEMPGYRYATVADARQYLQQLGIA